MCSDTPALKANEMDTSRPAVEALEDARAQTLASGSARIEFTTEHLGRLPPMPPREHGAIRTAVGGAAKVVGKRLWKLASRHLDWRHHQAEGVIDFTRRRYMIDYGSYAALYAQRREWSGRSGRRIDTLPDLACELPTPLWLIDVLAGVTHADDAGIEEIRGDACRRLAVTTDLSRASQLTNDGVGVPSTGRFDDLLALPLDVWIDDRHVRRVRFVSKDRAETAELWDNGASLDSVDWTRLPTFRSPHEAAAAAGHTHG